MPIEASIHQHARLRREADEESTAILGNRRPDADDEQQQHQQQDDEEDAKQKSHYMRQGPTATKTLSYDSDPAVEENPSMLTATDDEFSFQSHPSQAESWDEFDAPKPNQREFAGATVAGALAGLVLGGPLGAVAVAASTAYAVNSKSQAGNLVRKGGESVAQVGDRVLQSKTGKASVKQGEEALKEARKILAKNSKGLKKRIAKMDSKHKISNRAWGCCGRQPGEAVDDESFYLQTVKKEKDDDDTISEVLGSFSDNRRGYA